MIKSKYIKITFLLVTFCMLLPVFSQSKEDKPLFNFSSPIDTLYRKQLFDYLQIKTDVNADIVSYIVNADDNSFTLSPNERYLFRLSVDYKFLGFSIDFTPSFLPGNKDENLKGNTKYSRLGTRFNIGRTYNEMIYTKVQGYHFFDGELEEYILLPSYKTTSYFLKTNYILGNKYSLRAVKSQTERQIKSTGTFIPTLRLNYTDHALSSLDAILLGTNTPNGQKKLDIISTVGYHHLWVYKSFFCGGGLDPGLGFSVINAKNQSKKNKVDLILDLGAKFNIGYNSKRFFTGLEYNYEELYFSNNDFITGRNRNDFQLYIGFRFDMPKVIRKPFEWIERKTGF